MFRLFCLIITLCLALVVPALAGLEWSNPWQEFTRLTGDPAVDANYAFRNTGTSPVTITRIKTTCGCTTARLEKKTYAPGESGQIAVQYQFSNRAGPQRKLILVSSDDKPEATELNIVVNVHAPLTLTPALVYWRVGEANSAKSVQLMAEAGTSVHITGIRTTSPRIGAKLQTIKEGEHYNIEIVPADTTTREKAELSVQTDYPPDKPRAYTIHVRIK